VRAARLLAEIGDCRARFPDPESLICLAGAAPSTRRSGKHEAVTFHWAVNRELRDAVCDFAADSRKTNPWAAHLYNQAIARGKDHPHAARILARAWLYVIWQCWQDRTPYDPPARSPSNDSSIKINRRRLDTAAATAQRCPSLLGKRVHPHVLRHTCAMSLQAGVDTAVIALWLGHAGVRSTDAYVHADITIKEKALALTTPAAARPGRYRPPDKVLAFLEACDYAEPKAVALPYRHAPWPASRHSRRVGIGRPMRMSA
jgi:hypothetical protein